jgi:CheY-like chemotaxis protein
MSWPEKRLLFALARKSLIALASTLLCTAINSEPGLLVNFGKLGGLDVSIALGMKKAPDTARMSKPALILLSVNMRGVDGYEICEKLRNFLKLLITTFVKLENKEEALCYLHNKRPS